MRWLEQKVSSYKIVSWRTTYVPNVVKILESRKSYIGHPKMSAIKNAITGTVVPILIQFNGGQKNSASIRNRSIPYSFPFKKTLYKTGPFVHYLLQSRYQSRSSVLRHGLSEITNRAVCICQRVYKCARTVRWTVQTSRGTIKLK